MSFVIVIGATFLTILVPGVCIVPNIEYYHILFGVWYLIRRSKSYMRGAATKNRPSSGLFLRSWPLSGIAIAARHLALWGP